MARKKRYSWKNNRTPMPGQTPGLFLSVSPAIAVCVFPCIGTRPNANTKHNIRADGKKVERAANLFAPAVQAAGGKR